MTFTQEQGPKNMQQPCSSGCWVTILCANCMQFYHTQVLAWSLEIPLWAESLTVSRVQTVEIDVSHSSDARWWVHRTLVLLLPTICTDYIVIVHGWTNNDASQLGADQLSLVPCVLRLFCLFVRMIFSSFTCSLQFVIQHWYHSNLFL